MSDAEKLAASNPDPKDQIAHVRIGDITLSYRNADGGGRHYLGRTHSEEYHSCFLSLIRHALAPNFCIDIGANYGYTGMLMRRAFPDCDLTLVEPIPWLIDYIRYNFDSNNMKFDTLHSAICSVESDNGISTFGVREKATQDSRVIPQDGMNVIETQVVTLDDLVIKADPSDGVFIKIDTQGWEARVFASGEGFLSNHARWFVKTEFAPDWLVSQGSDPVTTLRWLLDQFEVYECPGRQRWNCESLSAAIGKPLLVGCEKDFVDYVYKLALNDKGWVDLFVLPPASRREYNLV